MEPEARIELATPALRNRLGVKGTARTPADNRRQVTGRRQVATGRTTSRGSGDGTPGDTRGPTSRQQSGTARELARSRTRLDGSSESASPSGVSSSMTTIPETRPVRSPRLRRREGSRPERSGSCPPRPRSEARASGGAELRDRPARLRAPTPRRAGPCRPHDSPRLRRGRPTGPGTASLRPLRGVVGPRQERPRLVRRGRSVWRSRAHGGVRSGSATARHVLLQWSRVLGSSRLTAHDAIRTAATERRADEPDFHGILCEIAGDRAGNPDARRLGIWLARNESRRERVSWGVRGPTLKKRCDSSRPVRRTPTRPTGPTVTRWERVPESSSWSQERGGSWPTGGSGHEASNGRRPAAVVAPTLASTYASSP